MLRRLRQPVSPQWCSRIVGRNPERKDITLIERAHCFAELAHPVVPLAISFSKIWM